MRPVPKADNLPPPCAVVMKSGNLNFLEPSGPLQACNGTAFTFTFRDLYSLPNIVRVVKSRRMRWAGHVARIGEGRGVHRVLVGETRGKEAIGETQT